MSNPLLTFNREVCITWEDRRGGEHEAYVLVTYTYDGEELTITNQHGGEEDNHAFNELVYEALLEEADERYAEELEELA